MTEERDVMLDQILSALRPLPTVDEAAKARVLIAVAAERERDREEAVRRVARRGRWRWTGLGTVAAAAVLLAMFFRPSAPPSAPAVPAPAIATAPATATGAQLAAHDAVAEADAARQSVQLVFRAPNASTVRVVGDFNSWDAERAPMTRDAATGLWSVTLQLRPGRHVYAYVVDDSVWVRDPRAPAAKDADFGRPGSVLLVGRP